VNADASVVGTWYAPRRLPRIEMDRWRDGSECSECGAQLVRAIWGNPSHSSWNAKYKGATEVQHLTVLYPLCPLCAMQTVAEMEAKYAGLRFVRMGFRKLDRNDPAQLGQRCPCGHSSIERYGYCFMCLLESKRLGEQERAATFNRRLISQLKKVLKDGKDHENRRAA
jgi:hypothetical protein